MLLSRVCKNKKAPDFWKSTQPRSFSALQSDLGDTLLLVRGCVTISEIFPSMNTDAVSNNLLEWSVHNFIDVKSFRHLMQRTLKSQPINF